jgi:hypothetical protein
MVCGRDLDYKRQSLPLCLLGLDVEGANGIGHSVDEIMIHHPSLGRRRPAWMFSDAEEVRFAEQRRCGESPSCMIAPLLARPPFQWAARKRIDPDQRGIEPREAPPKPGLRAA